jgi:hypothetical protein
VKTGKSLKDIELENTRSHRRSTTLYYRRRLSPDSLVLVNEEIKICKNLISLLVDSQDETSSLHAACDWYRNFLKFNTEKFWPLIQSALKDVAASSERPSRKDFAVVISFVHEIARKLVTEKDVALCDIVDPLANTGYFKPELDKDEYGGIPTQLVFVVIGWLRK